MALYVSVQDIRDEGVDVADFSDAEVTAAITLWQTFIDRACRQWFESKTLTLNVDGTDSDTIHFGVPVIDIDYIKINDSTDELNTDYYKVYNSRVYPDERRNPRIKLIRSSNSNIYSNPLTNGTLKFRKGRQNQEIKGDFGFIEEDDSVPLLIQYALKKLVVEKLRNPMYGDPPSGIPAPPPLMTSIVEEVTDGHKIKYGPGFDNRKPGLTGVTSDQEIHDIVRMFRAPIGVATPSHWSTS